MHVKELAGNVPKFFATDWVFILFLGVFPFFLIQNIPQFFPVYSLLLFVSVFALGKLQILTSLIAFIVLNTTSNWYSESGSGYTLYDIDVFSIKLAEIFTLGCFLKILILDGFVVNLKMKKWICLWGLAIILSMVVAYLKGVSLRDSFIFSEFRGLLMGLVWMLMLPSLIGDEIDGFIGRLVAFSIYKIFLTLPEYVFGVPVLWYTVAENYSSTNNAFFGSVDDLIFPLLIVCYALSLLIFRGADRRSLCFLLLMVGYAIIFLSMKRSFVLASAFLFLYCLTWLPLKRVLNVAVSASVLVVLFLMCVQIFGYGDKYQGIVERVSGVDARVDMSNKGRILDVIDGVNSVIENPILGSGVGSRIYLSRSYLFGENIHYLMVHQSVLHVWIKYGLYGFVLYIYTYMFLILYSRRHALMVGGDRDRCQTACFLLLFSISLLIVDQFNAAFFQNFRKVIVVASLIYCVEKIKFGLSGEGKRIKAV